MSRAWVRRAVPRTSTLVEVDGRTTVTSTSHMGSPEIIDAALSTGMTKGAIETWDRLAALLAQG